MSNRGSKRSVCVWRVLDSRFLFFEMGAVVMLKGFSNLSSQLVSFCLSESESSAGWLGDLMVDSGAGGGTFLLVGVPFGVPLSFGLPVCLVRTIFAVLKRVSEWEEGALQACYCFRRKM